MMEACFSLTLTKGSPDYSNIPQIEVEVSKDAIYDVKEMYLGPASSQLQLVFIDTKITHAKYVHMQSDTATVL